MSPKHFGVCMANTVFQAGRLAGRRLRCAAQSCWTWPRWRGGGRSHAPASFLRVPPPAPWLLRVRHALRPAPGWVHAPPC